jgi:hypothetical protein
VKPGDPSDVVALTTQLTEGDLKNSLSQKIEKSLLLVQFVGKFDSNIFFPVFLEMLDQHELKVLPKAFCQTLLKKFVGGNWDCPPAILNSLCQMDQKFVIDRLADSCSDNPQFTLKPNHFRGLLKNLVLRPNEKISLNKQQSKKLLEQVNGCSQDIERQTLSRLLDNILTSFEQQDALDFLVKAYNQEPPTLYDKEIFEPLHVKAGIDTTKESIQIALCDKLLRQTGSKATPGDDSLELDLRTVQSNKMLFRSALGDICDRFITNPTDNRRALLKALRSK